MSTYVQVVLRCDYCGKTETVMGRRRARERGTTIETQRPSGWRVVAEDLDACSVPCLEAVQRRLT